eukprot:7125740-Pyramimonas_sp.AAC.1
MVHYRVYNERRFLVWASVLSPTLTTGEIWWGLMVLLQAGAGGHGRVFGHSPMNKAAKMSKRWESAVHILITDELIGNSSMWVG